MSKLYVHYGCGFHAPEDWLNFDASPRLRFERSILGRFREKNKPRFPYNVRYGDIVKGLPIPDRSACGVYSCHMLDYLSYSEFVGALANTKKILAPRGTFRLVVDDCRVLIQRYLSDSSSNACSRFMEQSYWGRKEPKTILSVLKYYLGHAHRLWMWDYKGLEVELAQAGFTSIRKANFGDSEDSRFRSVEQQSTWENAVAIDCKA